VRDPRGFALWLYTEEGNYDLVGNNMPILIRDPKATAQSLDEAASSASSQPGVAATWAKPYT